MIKFSRIKIILLSFSAAYFLAIAYIGVRYFILNYYNVRGLLFPDGTNHGGDFPIFYVAGKIFSSQRTELYNFDLQLLELRSLLVGTSFEQMWLVFVYPPPVAALFSLLSGFYLVNAYLIWLAVSIIIFLISSFIIITRLEISWAMRGLIFLSGLSFVPFIFNCLGGGQLSILGLAIFSAGFYFRKHGDEWREGLVLGLGFYKPPLFLFMGCLAIAERRWRTVGGALLSGFLMLVWSIYLVGTEGFLKFLSVASNYRYGKEQTVGVLLPPFRGVGLYALLTQSIPAPVYVTIVYGIVFLSFLIGLAWLKKFKSKSNENPIGLIYSAEISISVMLSIQCINYDLTLLLPALYYVFAYVLSKPISANRIALILSLVLFQTEWWFRTQRGTVEHSPVIPMLLFCWSLAIITAIYRAKFYVRSPWTMNGDIHPSTNDKL